MRIFYGMVLYREIFRTTPSRICARHSRKLTFEYIYGMVLYREIFHVTLYRYRKPTV